MGTLYNSNSFERTNLESLGMKKVAITAQETMWLRTKSPRSTGR
jgi:hypothetical protein